MRVLEHGEFSCAPRAPEAGGADRKSILALQVHRQSAQSKQQGKFALVETNSQLCSFKASVYKSKPRLRRAFSWSSPPEVPPAGLLPGRRRSAGRLGSPRGGGWGGERALHPLGSQDCSPLASQGSIWETKRRERQFLAPTGVEPHL